MISLTDNEQLLRQSAFALLLARHSPVPEADLVNASGVGADVIGPALDRLAGLGWIDRDGHGQVTGSEGLSLTNGPHQLALDEGRFQTWCAYDALGIAAALAADATIDTSCAVCGQILTIAVRAGRPVAGRPERLWLADGGVDLRADFCSPTVLLCSPEHAATWGLANESRGRALKLEEAASLGEGAWAPSSKLARSLRSP